MIAPNHETTPSGYSFIPSALVTSTDEARRLISEAVEKWRPEMSFFRVTDLIGQYAKPPYPEGLYIEAWRVQPAIQPDFDYPLVDGVPA